LKNAFFFLQAKFSQLLDSEAHYNAVHRHACSVCKKSLPSAHLLELHVTESHDSYFQVLYDLELQRRRF
jgi:hypothetical protein